MNNKRNIKINVPVLTRVEGEGALELDIRDNEIETLNLRIFEPPRYFEKFLEGKSYKEVPDITARICGICPVAYQMSAVQALEALFQFSANDWIINMRRLLYCGEWIQSHSLHIHLLAAPDFLGFNNALEMSQQHPEIVHRGLRLQDLGNQLVSFLGGRSVHPVGVLPGGFYRSPTKAEANALLKSFDTAKDDCLELIEWTCSLNLPDTSQDFVAVSLRNENEYPMYSGRLVSSAGLDIDITEYENHFEEFQSPHSTALHAMHHGEPYFVGPLARINLNQDLIPQEALSILQKANINLPSKNIFHSIIARAVELYIAIKNAINLLQNYSPTDTPYFELDMQANTGMGCTEAPRGFLWHKYTTDENGYITYANIIPPTSQNQAQIERDLKLSIMQHGLTKTDDDLRHFSETIIRNYDPCISCATHFLKLKVNRHD